jgi:RNA polymerase sigma-70 factor (ECF subfamily)
VRDREALNAFLASVERRACRMAQLALGNDQDALDVVQDAMLRLARRYAQRPPEQWRPLFHRILQNRIRDALRRRRVLRGVMAWLPWKADGAGEPEDPVQQFPDPAPGPVRELEGAQIVEVLGAALRGLPDRQREAFLLRSLQGLDVAETAQAMGCSEGSVKTHYFRALQALRSRLGDVIR